jgi:anti-sigma factor (TIGR02949 family)
MAKDHMMCEEVLKHLVAYLDREMDAATAGAIERHLEECRGCFSRAEFEKKLKRHLREASSTRAPESLRARIRGLIRKF